MSAEAKRRSTRSSSFGRNGSSGKIDPRRWVLAVGHMDKERDGRLRVGWAKRFVVLTKRALYYYKLPKGFEEGIVGEMRGWVALRSIIAVAAAEGSALKKEHCISIKCKPDGLVKNKTFAAGSKDFLMLKCDDEATATEWLSLIQAAIEKDRNRPVVDDDGNITPDDLSDTEPQTPAVQPVPAPAPPPVVARVVRGPSRQLILCLAAASAVCAMAMLFALNSVPSLPSQGSCAARSEMDGDESAALAAFESRLLLSTRLGHAGLFGLIAVVGAMAWLLRQLSSASRQSSTVAASTASATPAAAAGGSGREAASKSSKDGAIIVGEKGRMDAGSVPHVDSSIQHADCPKPSWGNMTAGSLHLRVGPNYKKNRKKEKSGPALYKLVGMDIIRDGPIIRNVAGQGRRAINHPPLPDWLRAPGPKGDADRDMLAACGLPALVVVNAQYSTTAPSLFGGVRDDDPFVSIVFWMQIKPETMRAAARLAGAAGADGAADPARDPAVALFQRYCREWKLEGNDVRRRLKGIGQIVNHVEIGVPTMLSRYNGKPAIIFKSGTVMEGKASCTGGPGASGTKAPAYTFLELGVDVSKFSYACRKGVQMMKDLIPRTHTRMGFVLQGEPDEELPEVLLGGGEVHGLDPDNATPLP